MDRKEPEVQEEEEEWRVLSRAEKEAGDGFFKAGKWGDAVEAYGRAIAVDVDNHVLYSNRSAAYLKKGDAKSKALKDAEKCIALQPEWVKGYSRLGAAQQALGRFSAASATFEKGLLLDKDNVGLLTALEACRKAEAAWKRQKEEEEKAAEAARKALEATEAEKAANDPFMSFMSEVGKASEEVKEKEMVKQKQLRETPKYTDQELGSGAEQYARLTSKNHQWFNLNPFSVLQLGTDATPDDVKQRYRKLSSLLHPDKLQQTGFVVDDPRLAFSYVKAAHLHLLDDKRRAITEANIEAARVDALNAMKKTNPNATESERKEAISKTTLKRFADIELERRRADELLKAHSAREKVNAEEQKRKEKESRDYHKHYTTEEATEKRINNWRNFAPGSKKPRLS